MNEPEVKKAFDEIEPQPGARERMYANILKKAAAQQAAQTPAEPAAEEPPAETPRKRVVPLWRRWGSLAACLVIVAAACVALPRLWNGGERGDPPVMVGSPFEDVSGPEGFEKLGFAIDAPAGAEDVTYTIADGEIARVDFTLAGRRYTYEAAKLEGNFSRAEGEAVGSVSLSAEYGAVLDRLSADSWRAHWTRDGVSYYLTNFDGAAEDAVTEAALALMVLN